MLETLPVSMQRCCLLQASSHQTIYSEHFAIQGTSAPRHFRCSGCGMDWEADADGAWKGVRKQTVIPIRPSKLFHLVEEEGPARIVQIRIPKRRNLDGPDRSAKLLETMVLLACMKITKAQKVFEIGTCLGSTAVNLALNSESSNCIFTLDLDPESAKTAQQTENDRETTQFHLSHPMEWERFGTLPIWPLRGNSTKFDFAAFCGDMDLVWIDGAHDYRTLQSDTHNAFLMARQDRLSVVAWHDYRNPETPDVTRLLDEQAELMKLYWIEDTMIVLRFNRPVKLEA